MREPTYPIVLALALMLVAPSFSAFGRGGRGGFEERTPEEQTIRAPEEQTPLRTQTLGGHVYHGQLAWRDGRWRHELRDGRDGWWWDVGGYWYYYPEQTEGPPDYVSDVEVADEATPATPSNSRSPPATLDWVSPPATSNSPSPPAPSASPSPPAPSGLPSPPAKIWISPNKSGARGSRRASATDEVNFDPLRYPCSLDDH
jgi:hypothetical protein